MVAKRKVQWLFSIALASAASSFASVAAGVPLAINVQTATLPNGLRVVLAPDDSSPTVAIAVYYNVGSRDEEQHRSGFAHLFEHMMFEGSANAPKGLFDRLMDRNGNSDANGTTSEDRRQRPKRPATLATNSRATACGEYRFQSRSCAGTR